MEPGTAKLPDAVMGAAGSEDHSEGCLRGKGEERGLETELSGRTPA